MAISWGPSMSAGGISDNNYDGAPPKVPDDDEESLIMINFYMNNVSQ